MNGAFYSPTPAVYDDPAAYGLDPADVTFRSTDGVPLRGWILPAHGTSHGVVLYFHGNYGNLTHYLAQIHWLPENGFTVFAFDYRGYGRSRGTPTRRGLLRDGIAALAFARDHPILGDQDRFVFGQSLGGAVAIPALAAAGDAGIRAVALEGTFHAYRAEARDMIAQAVRKRWGTVPCLGVQAALISHMAVSDALSPVEAIGRLSPTPVLLIHCTEDRTVLPDHSRRLFQASSDPKALWIVPDCGHLTLFDSGDTAAEYRRALVRFFLRHRTP